MKCKWCGAEVISIHAPLTGSDKEPDSNQRNPDISIHAPLTGSDRLRLGQSLPDPDFNPRSPHRERHSEAALMIRHFYFNPRSPHRERRLINDLRRIIRNFNPRSPHRERQRSQRNYSTKTQFQSTLPSQGATE